MKKRSMSAAVGMAFVLCAMAFCGRLESSEEMDRKAAQDERCGQPFHGVMSSRAENEDEAVARMYGWQVAQEQSARKVTIDKEGEPQLVPARGR